MDGMAMVTTLKSNAARNTAASTTASAYQRRELMDMTCRFAGSVPVGATLLPLIFVMCTVGFRAVLLDLLHDPPRAQPGPQASERAARRPRSEEHTSELQSLAYLVCRL